MSDDFQYIRPVDQDKFDSLAPDERFAQRLYDEDNGAKNCTVRYIRTPAGGGSPEGMHTHVVDQIFYLLSGTMYVEINGRKFTVQPNSVVVFPAGVPHRNWNDEETYHLAIFAPPPPASP